MEAQELKQLCKDIDATEGSFPETLFERNKKKRIKRLAAFTEVTHAVIETLQAWGMPFRLCEIIHGKTQKHRITTDIFIPYANIVIRQVDMSDPVEVSKASSFFFHMRMNYNIMFIRSTESKEFVLEKLQRTLMKANEKQMDGFNLKALAKAIRKQERELENNKQNIEL